MNHCSYFPTSRHAWVSTGLLRKRERCHVTDFLKYDFGYAWYISYGPAIPLVLAAAVVGLALSRGWPQWVSAIAGIVSTWALVGMFLINIAWGINKPMQPPTPRFLASGAGRCPG